MKNHACFYYNNTDGKNADLAILHLTPPPFPSPVKRLKNAESVMDVEDLVLMGSRQR